VTLLARFWPQLAGVALILAALAWVDHRGYARAEADAAAEKLERQSEALLLRAGITKEFDAKLGTIGDDLHGRLEAINTERMTNVDPILARELGRDPGLADPARCLTPGLLAAINAARGHAGAGHAAAPVGRDAASLPGSAGGN
jgi:hypothetical protein